ncbi:MAG TPA: UPF0182 family protein, partial [Terriglobia bacterium]|nr:UPF0182 family protein [Terriglobia bacterium]
MDPRAVRRFATRIVLIVFVLIVLFQAISIYAENLWFQSVGYSAVYWYQLRAQGTTFLAFGIASGVLIWMLLKLVMPSGSRPRGSLLRFGNEQINVPSPDSFRPYVLPVSAVVGVLFGLAFSGDWSTYALFLNRPAASGAVDPIFGQPLSFYFFSLPVLEAVAGWFLVIAFIGVAAAVVTAITDASGKFKGVSIGLGVLLFAIAAETYVYRYSLILESHNLITGVGYVEDHVVLPGLWFVFAALVLGALIAFANVRSGRIRNFFLAIAIPLVTYVIAGVLIPGYVATFVVRPNEFVKETPYIKSNIEFTRKAFDLDRVEEIPFVPKETNTLFDPAAHAPTIENIRLWDWKSLQ